MEIKEKTIPQTHPFMDLSRKRRQSQGYPTALRGLDSGGASGSCSIRVGMREKLNWKNQKNTPRGTFLLCAKGGHFYFALTKILTQSIHSARVSRRVTCFDFFFSFF